ncbi:MAG TPA: zinc finger domain-containing protein [Candidatus Thermoplasmatota archaeon]|nr:zinc finger domain-containing protein [Candidatus Thermoplasmatota archaeon]
MPRLTETCTSCGTRLIGKATTSFPCPGCGDGAVGRCAQCRDQGVAYVHEACGYAGP